MDLMQARQLLQQCSARPEVREQLARSHPSLATALATGDEKVVQSAIAELRAAALKEESRKRELLLRLQQDPFDTEAQALLETMIHQTNIDDALAEAREHIPESFGSVYMLYVPIEVNNTKIQAFVDSGAQVTIMSLPCANRCNLSRLVDRRFDGVAKGVGAANIVGRIHMADIKIGSQFFSGSFTVLEQDEPEILFGLDLLRKFCCSIDLKENCLRIGGEAVPFLGEHEIARQGSTASTEADLTAAPTIRPQSSNLRATSEIERIKIEQLTQLGFTESQAKNALARSQGNVDLAGSMLFQG